MCCLEYMIPPTAICVQNHVICRKCCENKENCPKCESVLMSKTNLALDVVLTNFVRPCRGKYNGCRKKLKWQELLLHEKECKFLKQTNCYFQDCYESPYCCVYDEHVQKHFGELTRGQNHSLRLQKFSVASAKWKNIRSSLFFKYERETVDGFKKFEHFELNFRCTDDKLQISSRYLGPPDEVLHHKLTIWFVQPGLKLKYEGPVHRYDTHEDDLWIEPMFILSEKQLNFSKASIYVRIGENLSGLELVRKFSDSLIVVPVVDSFLYVRSLFNEGIEIFDMES